MEGWFVVRTEISREVTASVSIAKLDFTVFLPMRTAIVSHARQRREVSRPLFGRYLFVHGHIELAGQTNHCRGVARNGLICTGAGKAQTLSADVINAIKMRETIHQAKAGNLKSGYDHGDEFQVQRGSYAELTATYIGEEKGKVQAIIHLFGRSCIVELPIEALPILKVAA